MLIIMSGFSLLNIFIAKNVFLIKFSPFFQAFLQYLLTILQFGTICSCKTVGRAPASFILANCIFVILPYFAGRLLLLFYMVFEEKTCILSMLMLYCSHLKNICF